MKINDLYESDNEETVTSAASRIQKSPYYSKVLKPQLEKLKKYDPNILTHDYDDEYFHRYMFENLIAIYHGTKRVDQAITEITQKERDLPLDTSDLVHDTVNKMANKKLGMNVRNGMFGTLNAQAASAYGKVTMLIPLGDYKIFYCPDIKDFTDQLQVAGHNDFGAGMIYNLVDIVAREAYEQRLLYKLGLVSESIDVDFFMTMFESIPEHITYKSFDDIFNVMLEAVTKNIKDAARVYNLNIDNAAEKKIVDWAKDAIQDTINEKVNRLQQYVNNMVVTQTIDDISDEELILWFDKAYLLLTSRRETIDVIKKLLEEL